MDVCKKCGSIEFNFVKKIIADGRMQIKQTCKHCDTFIKWAKQSDVVKTKEQYKNEYMENQEATPKQIYYLRELCNYSGEIKNKLHASELIERYKNNET